MGPRDKEGICVAFPLDVARCSLPAAKRVLVVVAVAIFATAGYVLVVPTTGEATPSCIPGTMESYVSLGKPAAPSKIRHSPNLPIVVMYPVAAFRSAPSPFRVIQGLRSPVLGC